MTYIPALDGLRGVAILCVLLYHLDKAHGGFLGVDIFFVLSGFLITALLLREQDATGRIDLRRFYCRRILRLMPALFVYVAVCGVVLLLSRPEAWGTTTLLMITTLTYMTNWAVLAGWATSSFTHTWSLSIEEQFYLIWPPLVALMLRYRRRRVAIGLAIIGTATSIGLRYVLWEGAASVPRLYFALDARLDSLLLGALAAFAIGSVNPHRWYGIAAGVATIWIIGCIVWADWTSQAFYFGIGLLVNVAVVVVIFGVLLAPASWVASALSTSVMIWTGRLSYSLYLWHYGVIFNLWPDASRLWQLVALLALAGMSYALVEKPARRYGLRRFQSPGNALVVAQPVG